MNDKRVRSQRIAPGVYGIYHYGALLGFLRKGARSFDGTTIHRDWYFTYWLGVDPADYPNADFLLPCHLPSGAYSTLSGSRDLIFDQTFARKADALRQIAVFARKWEDEIAAFHRWLEQQGRRRAS